MTIQYLPNEGFNIEAKEIKWGDKRDVIRQLLSEKFQPHDGILDNSQFFDGDTSYNIRYRQDLYENYKLTFDENDRIKEFEIHRDADIFVLGIKLTFGNGISEFVDQFKNLNHHPAVVKEGEFFFERLKMVIATSASMGGEGTGLEYFYAGADVNHVIEEYTEMMKGI